MLIAVARRGSQNNNGSSGRAAKKNHTTVFKAVFIFLKCLFGQIKSLKTALLLVFNDVHNLIIQCKANAKPVESQKASDDITAGTRADPTSHEHINIFERTMKVTKTHITKQAPP